MTAGPCPVLVTALLVSMGGPYSAYFGTFLLVVGGFIGFVRRPSLDRALDAAVCVGLVVGLFLLQVLPFVVGSHRQGRVQTTVTRTMDDYYVHAPPAREPDPAHGRAPPALAEPALGLRTRREPQRSPLATGPVR